MIKKVINSFGFALKGVKDVWLSQNNAKIHTVIALLVVIFGIVFKISIIEWALVSICITFVWGAEALNTSIEHLIDLVSPGFHPLAGKAKDAAAGFVLVIALGAAICGLLIFLPKILALM